MTTIATPDEAELDAALGAVEQLLTTADGSPFAIAEHLLRLIDATPPALAPTMLQYAMRRTPDVESDKSRPLTSQVSDSEYSSLAHTNGPAVDALLRQIVAQNPSEDDFCRMALALINMPLYSDDASRAFALHWLLLDEMVPYFQLGGPSGLDESDWTRLGNELATEIARAWHVFGRRIDSRLEEAHHLVDLLAGRSPAEQARLVAIFVRLGELRAERAARRQQQ